MAIGDNQAATHRQTNAPLPRPFLTVDSLPTLRYSRFMGNVDTLKAYETLIGADMPDRQARALISIVQELQATQLADVARQGDLTSLQTSLSDELAQFRLEFVAFEADMRHAMEAFKADIRQDMEAFKAEVRQDMEAFKAEVRQEMEAFKADIREDMVAFKADIRAEIAAVKNALHALEMSTKADIALLRSEMKERAACLEAKIDRVKLDMIKWFIPLILGQGAFIVALLKIIL